MYRESLYVIISVFAYIVDFTRIKFRFRQNNRTQLNATRKKSSQFSPFVLLLQTQIRGDG
jgi:hypothetical protein